MTGALLEAGETLFEEGSLLEREGSRFKGVRRDAEDAIVGGWY